MTSIKAGLETKLIEYQRRAGVNKSSLVIQSANDPLDRALDESNRMAAASLGENDRGVILAIQEALGRIEDGSYGVCVRCDENIPPSRLLALPWATQCRDCQEFGERHDKEKKPTKKLVDHRKIVEDEAPSPSPI